MKLNSSDLKKSIGKGAKAAGGVAATAVAGSLAFSWFGIDHKVPLPPALQAERKQFQSRRAGVISYYADRSGTGAPLVLIHSINAAPSAHEMKPLFNHFRGKRPVYALDLPGFGFSERSRRRYTPQLYAAAIVDFLTIEVGSAADVVALSLSSEFAAQATLDAPEYVRSLALISPTGLSSFDPALPGELTRQLFAFPLWGQPFYDLLTSRASIALFLGRNFVEDPPQDFLDYGYATAHQPGARHAPFYFLSGQLFRGDVRTAVYEKIARPTLVLYDRDPNVSFPELPELLRRNDRWRAVRVAPSLGLPHWEELEQTVAALEQFWSE